MSAETRPVVTAAAPESRTGALALTAVVGALLLGGAGVALVQQGLVDGGVLAGQGWLTSAVGWLDATTAATAAAVMILVAVLGLVLLLAAVVPRRRAELPLPGAPGVVVEPGDLARIASATAETVDGVLTATSVASRRRVTVDVESTGAAHVPAAVRGAVAERFESIGLDVAVGARDAVRGSGRQQSRTELPPHGGTDA